MVPTGREDLLSGLVQVADLLLTDLETEVVMQRMADVLTRAVPDVASASVTVRGGPSAGRRYEIVAASGEAAARIDDVQYSLESGPCVRALQTGLEVVVARLPAEEWPEFSAAALEHGIGWSVSVPMQNGLHRGVLNMYAACGSPYSEQEHLQPARVFARYAATILAAHSRFVDATTEARQLQQAMVSRATIEQAKGMIMFTERCSADEAFQILVQTSQRSHLKLRDVAALVISRVTEQAHSRPPARLDGRRAR